MKKQTLGMMISSIRKDKGMTQLDLAKEMGVTDKAVSKWERDLSCPDISSFAKLAEVLNVSIDELMQTKTESRSADQSESIRRMIHLILKAVSLAMGVCVVVLSILKSIDIYSGFTMVGIGMVCAGVVLLQKEE